METEAGPAVKAGAVVVATNTPINDMVAIHTKQAPYLTYAIGVRVPRDSVTRALYWDTLEAYHYVRVKPMDRGGDMLIVGGEDHKAGQADDQAGTLGPAGGMDPRAVPHDGVGRIPMVRHGHGDDRRAGLHRPEPDGPG